MGLTEGSPSPSPFGASVIDGLFSLRKPKVFTLQILQRYLTNKVTFENFSTVHMDKRTLRSKI